jgi:hypothetical protein
MENWKPLLGEALSKKYPGARLEWSGDDPTLIIPDPLIEQQTEIIQFACDLWSAWGGEVVFFPERAVRRSAPEHEFQRSKVHVTR